MAAAILPEIGSKKGPCLSCNHSDCSATRQMAAAVCPYCNKPIGYSTRFYETDEFGLVHASCYEDAVEQARATDVTSC